MIRMHAFFVLGFLFAVFGVSPVAQLPKPGQDHLKLEPLIGAWTFEWNLKASPVGPAGKITGTETYQWLPGQFFLQMDRELKTPVGQVLQRAILSYDTLSKKYTMNVFGLTDGSVGSFIGTVNGTMWNWSGAGPNGLAGTLNGKPFHDRCTWTVPDRGNVRDAKCEASLDGKAWAPSLEATYTKLRR